MNNFDFKRSGPVLRKIVLGTVRGRDATRESSICTNKAVAVVCRSLPVSRWLSVEWWHCPRCWGWKDRWEGEVFSSPPRECHRLIKEACDTEADKSEVGGVRRGPQGRVQRAGGT